MTETDTDDAALYGFGVHVVGLKIMYWAFVLFVFLELAGPMGEAMGVLAAMPVTEEMGQLVALGLFVAAVFVLVGGLFLAVYLFVSAHMVAVELTVVGEGVAADLPRATTTLEPELVFPAEFAGLFYLLPPALLLGAGYLEYESEGDVFAAVWMVMVGYGVVALATIVPVAWVFNAYVGDFLVGLVTGPVDVPATLTIQLPNVVGAHLIVGLVYPAVFGGIGAAVAAAMDDSPTPAGHGGPARQPQDRGRPQQPQGHHQAEQPHHGGSRQQRHGGHPRGQQPPGGPGEGGPGRQRDPQDSRGAGRRGTDRS